MISNTFWMASCSAILFVSGCGAVDTSTAETKSSRQSAPANQQPDSGTGAAANEAGAGFSFRVSDGRLRVHWQREGDKPVLVRSIAWNAAQFDEDAKALQLAHERAAQTAWQRGSERWRLRPPKSDAEQHDALLEAAEQLEAAYESDQEHLGILRDLITTYSRLLAFEGRSSLGTKLCVLASRRLAEFTVMARPWEAADEKWVAQIRAWLHFQMHQYPKAAEMKDDATQAALSAIGQPHFLALRPVRDGRLKIQPYRTLGDAWASTLPRDELHFLASYDDEHAPDALRVFCLVRQGEGTNVRWYLDAHFLNRSMLVRLYGKDRPDDETVMNDVQDRLKQDLEAER